MKKNVWLINQYLCTPELNGDDHRHSLLAEEFIRKGYDITLITSSFSHVPIRENKFKGLFKVLDGDIRTLLIKGNKYKSTQGISRVFSWLIFCFLLFFIPTKKIAKPDIIIVSSNSLLPILNVVFYFKKKFKNVKFILEIRDIWPLSLIEIGNFSEKNILIRFLGWVEKLGYQKADYIVSLLSDCDKHIKKVLKNNDFNYEWISNGYKLKEESYYQNIPKSVENQIPYDSFVIGYAGSLGKANAMEYIIQAVGELQDENIALCILGNGDEKENLVKLAKDTENIFFIDRIAKNQVLSFLEKCDLLYFSSKDLHLYSYGISANKSFDYMYASKPILLSAPKHKSIIDLSDCGKLVPAENISELKKAIREFVGMETKKMSSIGLNGKSYLKSNFTYEILAEKFIKVFESV